MRRAKRHSGKRLIGWLTPTASAGRYELTEDDRVLRYLVEETDDRPGKRGTRANGACDSRT